MKPRLVEWWARILPLEARRRSAVNHSCRLILVVLFGVVSLIVLPAAAGNEPQTGGERMDWLRLVPGEARFYVEVRQLSGIQRLFQRLGIWRTVRELAERDSLAATSQPWRRTSEEYLGLTPERAIHRFLGRRTALIATESAQWQGGVVLAELEKPATLAPWLKRWRARSLPDEGPVRRYELTGGILLAVRDGTLAFGPAGDPEGLWARTVLLLAGRRGPTLAGRSEFAALRSRLSSDHGVLLYVVWPEGDPTAISGCRRLLVGVSVNESGIFCELQGQRGGPIEMAPEIDVPWLCELPSSTLAVRAGSSDLDGFLRQTRGIAAAQQDPVISLLLRGFLGGDDEPGAPRLSLGPSYCLVVGRDRSSSLGLEMPALTWICRTPDGERLVERLDRTLGFIASLLARTSLAPRVATSVSVEVEDCEGVALHHVAIGPVLAERTGLLFLDRLDPCWAWYGGRLLLSSSLTHAREIVLAATGKGVRLGDDPGARDLFPGAADDDRLVEWWFARGNRIAELLENWRGYLAREQPQALKPEWWQDWAAQQMAHRTRLGVGLAVDQHDPRRAVVKELSRKSPALRYLRIGDVIVGAGGSPLATTQPAQEVAERYSLRPDARKFELDVIRAGRGIKVTIPVPQTRSPDLSGFDPIRGVDRWTTLSRCADVATVWVFGGSPDRLDARMLIKWKRPAPPKSKGADAGRAGVTAGRRTLVE